MREHLNLHTDSAAATRELGAQLGRVLLAASTRAPIIIALNGDLGAGKTTLISGLLQALGFCGPVRSPTYTLIETYELGGREFHHLDLYRLTGAAELESLGFHDLLRPGAVVLIEWAERIVSVLPTVDLSIDIKYVPARDDARSFGLAAGSDLGQELVTTAFSSR